MKEVEIYTTYGSLTTRVRDELNTLADLVSPLAYIHRPSSIISGKFECICRMGTLKNHALRSGPLRRDTLVPLVLSLSGEINE